MFLTQDDFNSIVKTEKLDKIIENNPTLLEDTILIAVAEANSYLSKRYDTAPSFAATGSDRNPILVSKCTDIVMYHLFTRITPTNVPEIRGMRYEAAIDWLKMISKGAIQIELPVKVIDNQTGYILFGGNPQFRFR
jgi:phage gp36-like protein